MLQNTKTWKSRNCVIIIIKIVLLKHNFIIFINKMLLAFHLWKILNFEVFEDILIWISRHACLVNMYHSVYHNFNMPIPQFRSLSGNAGNNVDLNTQNKIFVEFNTTALPYFGQISKTIQFMFKKFLIHTIFRMTCKVETIIILVILNKKIKKTSYVDLKKWCSL